MLQPYLLLDLLINQENILKQLYYLIIIENILQDIELKYIDPTKIFKNSNNSIQTLCSKQYEPYEKYEIESKTTFLEEFIKKNYPIPNPQML